MKLLPITLALAGAFAAEPVRVYEGTLTIPTYEHSGRETEPALFAKSTVTGMYPFTTYLMPFQPDGPKPKVYQAVFVENEYLKLTYIPEFGGRIFSLFDKIRGREVFYRNDVIKPASYNPRNSWPQSGLELTGPHDLHMLTLHGEPYWSHIAVKNADGSVTLALGETDPVYGMEVELSARLHPGVAALEIAVRCYNARNARMPQMLWINTAINATEKTRFLYPMTRTVGHTTADVADWPLYNGIDYSWDRNNTHMLGVFGIDSFDDYGGAYQFDRDYGIFRYADRRVTQGMKLWTFGYGDSSKSHERGYTDRSGPYVELQSGRYVWDGHYEWVAPHQTEGWNEWWVPVAGTGGLTGLSRDVALRLETPELVLAATRALPGAEIIVGSGDQQLLRVKADLDPARPFRSKVALPGVEAAVAVRVTDADGRTVLDYQRPAAPRRRGEYTPFTQPLEKPRKDPEKMSAEELVLAAEYRLKELDEAGASALLAQALSRDAGYSRAHLQLGIQDYQHGRFEQAAERLAKVIERDPYSTEAYYYLAMSQLALGREAEAERSLYFIWPDSGFYAVREYQLGRLSLLRGDLTGAIRHLTGALNANAGDLTARVTLALALHARGEKARAEQELSAAAEMQPSSRLAPAARYVLNGDAASQAALLALLGRQSQEAVAVSRFYSDLRRWSDAVKVLRVVEQNNGDPFGTPAEFYYTLAYNLRRASGDAAADEALKRAKASANHIDRFPSRPESLPVLAEAAQRDPGDGEAHYLLGCLEYHLGHPADAIAHWRAAVSADGRSFPARRVLGLGLAEQGAGVDEAAAQLAQAVALNPAHARTLNDLSNLYARAGRFDEQLQLLTAAFARNRNDDDLAESVLTAYLLKGQYDEAERLVKDHQFRPRHRSYELRDKYRMMRYAQGSSALNRGDASLALSMFQESARPPISLGIDDFAAQDSPRREYYLGRAYQALGRAKDAEAAYAKAVEGVARLSGDRDSWNSENYFMVLALERLGRKDEAARLEKRFEDFAKSEADDRMAQRRSEARYLLALIGKRGGKTEEALKLLRSALDARPDLMGARLELRGESPDPLTEARPR